LLKSTRLEAQNRKIIAMSLLAAIRAAVRPAADVLLEIPDDTQDETETQPLRNGANLKEGVMPNDNPVPGADQKPGISEADHKAAVTKAEADGRAAGKAEGAKEANDRFAAVFGAEGIKGDGKRMSAALDLMTASPNMAAEAVVSFVTGNVTAAAQPSSAATYEGRRLAAAQLTNPSGGKPAGEKDTSVLAAAVDRTNKRNRR
jgi:hypothetical protein